MNNNILNLSFLQALFSIKNQLLLQIVNYLLKLNSKYSQITISQETIGNIFKKSRKTINEWMEILNKLGLIQKINRQTKAMKKRKEYLSNISIINPLFYELADRLKYYFSALETCWTRSTLESFLRPSNQEKVTPCIQGVDLNIKTHNIDRLSYNEAYQKSVEQCHIFVDSTPKTPQQIEDAKIAFGEDRRNFKREDMAYHSSSKSNFKSCKPSQLWKEPEDTTNYELEAIKFQQACLDDSIPADKKPHQDFAQFEYNSSAFITTQQETKTPIKRKSAFTNYLLTLKPSFLDSSSG